MGSFNIYSKKNLKMLFTKDQNDENYCCQIFEALYNFYKAFYCSKNYTMKIMITRRSYVLFKIFSRCFENENIVKYGSFYTNTFISKLTKEQIESNKILIIDDIIINGRTAGNSYDQLVKITESDDSILQNAFITAFLLNREGRCLNRIDKYLIAKDKIATTNEYGWREISDLLNVFIARVNIGYVSYIDTYHLPMVPNYENFENQSNVLFSNNNIKSYIYFPDEKDSSEHKEFFVLLERLNIVPCYRLYNYNGSWNFIPFVYLPTIKKDDFLEYFSCIVRNLHDKQEKFDFIKNKVFSDINLEDEYIFWYEWLTFILSKCLADIYFKDNNLSYTSQMLVNLDCVENFKDYYFDSICLNESINLPNRRFCCSEDDIIMSKEKECVELFKKLYTDNNANLDTVVFSEYLFQSRCIGQNRALSNLCRLRGIRVEDISYMCNESNTKIIKEIINRWDCGDGSGSPKLFGNNQEFISTSIINGEQVYRYPFDINMQVTFDFKILYDNCLLPVKMLMGAFTEFASYMFSQVHNSDYMKFANNFNEDNYDEFENSINSDSIIDTKSVSYKHFSLITHFIDSYLSQIFRE